MAKRISLREFQSQLSARLGSARRGEASGALLGIESGTLHPLWLLDLADSGEIATLPPEGLVPVPLTKAWFAGVVNIRGTLYSVVDFSAFRGDEATPINTDARLLLVGTRHGINSALLVGRALGLRAPDTLSPVPGNAAGAPAWQGERLLDGDGRQWQRLDIPALLADAAFLDIAA